ncbi:hypothetical protein BpHYR1_004221 [Brachionus plicatilis]|uniref:Uncharacterized protein n=1 Tax=Brachionus plicatilis TaxID=10195 RepID=A0A3M7QVZ7_BRAPC|nr:hypothetical protein BpHYR1_004221 [Brachionus plicatilis]
MVKLNGLIKFKISLYIQLNHLIPHDARCWRDKEKNNLKLIRPRIYKDFVIITLYLEKTTEHDFSTDIFIFHLISHCSSSLRIQIL